MEIETQLSFEQRKQDHIHHCLNDTVDASSQYFDSIHLNHEALPDLNLKDINIKVNILGHTFSSPIFISSMTAGHQQGQKLNYLFADVCEQKNWLLNVGSQRKQLFDDQSKNEWSEIKKDFPKVKMCANIGLAQVIQHSVKDLEAIINSIGAIGLIVHLNSLQESLQLEGTTDFKGGFEKICQITKELQVPVILKETGCGFSKETLLRLNDSGVSVVDISGYGGTHWGRVEGLRAQAQGDRMLAEMALTFSNWGESTRDTLMGLTHMSLNYNVWASGGVRNGLDVAKSIAMGASAAGLARPFLLAALKGKEELLFFMDRLEQELKVSMFCTGSAELKDLQGKWKWINKN